MASEFIYVNAPLPMEYEPPRIVANRTLPAEDLTALITSNDVVLGDPSGATVAEKLLNIFLDPEVLFGNPSFIPEHRELWIEKFGYFIDRNEPITFVSMAFPYKVPNPVKTGERRAPDLGEALMLRRFAAVLDAVSRVYEPGAELVILEEGILGRCQGVDPRDIAAYRAGIEDVVRIAAVSDRIRFHSLDDMAVRIPNFEARWYFEQERLRRLWDEGDPYMRQGYGETYPGSRLSVPTRDYDPAVLVKAYCEDETDSALRYVRQYVDYVAHRQFFAYRALLNMRDTTGYLEDIAPGNIKLTVSPKATNLAVLPVNGRTKTLPYHGAPLRDADGSWTIEYHAALGAHGDLEALYLENSADPSPIGYVKAAS